MKMMKCRGMTAVGLCRGGEGGGGVEACRGSRDHDMLGALDARVCTWLRLRGVVCISAHMQDMTCRVTTGSTSASHNDDSSKGSDPVLLLLPLLPPP